jgi:hypothetical protein
MPCLQDHNSLCGRTPTCGHVNHVAHVLWRVWLSLIVRIISFLLTFGPLHNFYYVKWPRVAGLDSPNSPRHGQRSCSRELILILVHRAPLMKGLASRSTHVQSRLALKDGWVRFMEKMPKGWRILTDNL